MLFGRDDAPDRGTWLLGVPSPIRHKRELIRPVRLQISDDLDRTRKDCWSSRTAPALPSRSARYRTLNIEATDVSHAFGIHRWSRIASNTTPSGGGFTSHRPPRPASTPLTDLPPCSEHGIIRHQTRPIRAVHSHSRNSHRAVPRLNNFWDRIPPPMVSLLVYQERA